MALSPSSRALDIATRNYDDDSEEDYDEVARVQLQGGGNQIKKTRARFSPRLEEARSPFTSAASRVLSPPAHVRNSTTAPVPKSVSVPWDDLEEHTKPTTADGPLRAARLRSEELAKRVHSEQSRMVEQRKKMLELERKSQRNEQRVASAEAKLKADEERLREHSEKSAAEAEARLRERTAILAKRRRTELQRKHKESEALLEQQAAEELLLDKKRREESLKKEAERHAAHLLELEQSHKLAMARREKDALKRAQGEAEALAQRTAEDFKVATEREIQKGEEMAKQQKEAMRLEAERHLEHLAELERSHRAEMARREKEALERAAKEREEASMEIEAQKEEAARRRAEAAAKLLQIEAENAELEARFLELERERAHRESELAAAEQQCETRNINHRRALADVMYAEDDEEAVVQEEKVEELPEAHRKAAAGDVDRMSRAECLERDLSERTPLFYAAAAGQFEAVKWLLAMEPSAAALEDVNGDTALHAAASSGAADCARELARLTNARVANKEGMEPAHLCSDAETLECLLEAGADFSARDAEKRTPLFVACAMNRFDCATLMLEVLDASSDQKDFAAAADKRADTPLHAAACNGAEACLRLLLESGVITDVEARNLAGLRPRDLASRRDHAGCEKLLVEYALHNATDSTFDSMLFLATLKGHRECKKQLEEASEAAPYEILRRTNSKIAISSKVNLSATLAAAATSTLAMAAAASAAALEQGSEHEALKRKESRWSLRRGKSMKLSQWGSWIAYEDPENAGTVFWYNHQDGKGQWAKPQALIEAEMTSSSSKASWGSDLRHKSMRLSQQGEWLQYRENSTSKLFYYHPTTGEFQWERPSSLPPVEEADVVNEEEESEWKQYNDPETGLPFWHNHVSGESLWEDPTVTLTREDDANAATIGDDLSELGI